MAISTNVRGGLRARASGASSGVTSALAAGHGVIVWPGGEQDAMRNWRKRDPFGIALEILPTHIPLPAKIRTELLEPIRVDHDPSRARDHEYVDRFYGEVESAIEARMGRLAARHRFPIFG
jgi:hypothetical protein